MKKTETSETIAAWNASNEKDAAELAAKDEKSAISFYGIAGVIIIVLGVIVSVITGIVSGLNAIALGVLVMGVGEILRYLRKISNQ